MTKSSEKSPHTGVPRRRLNLQKQWNPKPSGRRGETSGSLVPQSCTDGSVWENSLTDKNIPESTSAHFACKQSIKKTAEPDGEGVRKYKAKRAHGLKNGRAPSAQESSSMEECNKTSTETSRRRRHLKKCKHSSCSPFCWSHSNQDPQQPANSLPTACRHK